MAGFAFTSDLDGLVRGVRFSMDDFQVGSLTSAQVIEANPMFAGLRFNPSSSLRIMGADLTYGAQQQLTGGTVASLFYGSRANGPYNFVIDNLSLPATQVWSLLQSGSTQTIFASLLSGADYLRGSEGDDLMRGYAGPDSLLGEVGADSLFGGTGDDSIFGGGPGEFRYPETRGDLLRGEEGADSIVGGDGGDDISGGAGNDTLAGALGGDVYSDFAGRDTILDFRPAEGDRLRLAPGETYSVVQSGADTRVTLSTGAEIILADVSANTLIGAWISDGDPRFETISPAAALELSASDRLTFQTGAANQVSVRYGDADITLALGDRTIAFSPNIAAISKAGNVVMPDGSRLYIGGAGVDVFTGAPTGDGLFGGQGADTLDGARGGDLLQGNQGADQLLGGEGNDTIYGGQDDDAILTGPGVNFGQGNRGRDYLSGEDGADTLLGGQDNDTVHGGGGSDLINGNRGDDVLWGEAGNDTLTGEGGSDTIAGGAGADLFRGFPDGGLDQIVDFNRAEGDRIVLDAGTTYTVSQSGSDVVVAYGAGAQFVLVGVSQGALTSEWISA